METHVINQPVNFVNKWLSSFSVGWQFQSWSLDSYKIYFILLISSTCRWMCERVCVCEREREYVCVREKECVCVWGVANVGWTLERILLRREHNSILPGESIQPPSLSLSLSHTHYLTLTLTFYLALTSQHVFKARVELLRNGRHPYYKTQIDQQKKERKKQRRKERKKERKKQTNKERRDRTIKSKRNLT